MTCNSCIHIEVCGKYQATGGHVRNCKHFVTENNVGCKWIPVTERLPNQGDAVLVFDKYRCYYIGEYLYGESFKVVGYHSMTTAVAWMPLPGPPKECK